MHRQKFKNGIIIIPNDAQDMYNWEHFETSLLGTKWFLC